MKAAMSVSILGMVIMYGESFFLHAHITTVFILKCKVSFDMCTVSHMLHFSNEIMILNILMFQVAKHA